MHLRNEQLLIALLMVTLTSILTWLSCRCFAAIMPPKRDIRVRVTPGQGWQGNGIFKMGDPSARSPLLCGLSWGLGKISNEDMTKVLLDCSREASYELRKVP